MTGRPLIVGVTGGIGSGKSTVCRVFETLGAVTYYADDRAKWLMENDVALVNGIKELFGLNAYKQGKLDRALIASQVFKNSSLLEKLNALVHPAVAGDVERWIQQHQDAKLLLKEAALLFETGSYQSLDKTILVTAPSEVRVDRVAKRDAHRSADDVRDIISKQMKDEEKIPLADFVIRNDGKESLIEQVMTLFKSLIVT